MKLALHCLRRMVYNFALAGKDDPSIAQGLWSILPAGPKSPIWDIGERSEEEQSNETWIFVWEIGMSSKVMCLIHKPVVGKTAATA